jgi:hypothetical protein
VFHFRHLITTKMETNWNGFKEKMTGMTRKLKGSFCEAGLE